MPYSTLFIHLVWTTKDRAAYLTLDVRNKIINHILDNAKRKDIYILAIGGFTEHIHALVSLGSTQSVSSVMHLIKGESSYWINKSKLITCPFEWADDYFSVSVSPAIVDKVTHYICNQETHHKKKTFMDEYKEFLNSCAIDLDKA
jgi:REP element-mobilizing transposase RayT